MRYDLLGGCDAECVSSPTSRPRSPCLSTEEAVMSASKVRAFLDFLIERSFGVPGRYRKR
jgi:hypothetical protein